MIAATPKVRGKKEHFSGMRASGKELSIGLLEKMK